MTSAGGFRITGFDAPPIWLDKPELSWQDATVIKTKSASPAAMKPLADGQVWRMAESSLQVDMVGRLLVHYKLGKHGAVRISNSIGSQTDIVKFLKKNKAVLMKPVKVAAKSSAPAKTNGVAKKNGAPKKTAAAKKKK